METKAIQAISTMFGCFSSFGSKDELKFKLESYIIALDDLSTDEIVKVCSAAMRGEIGGQKFLPTTAELHHAARPTEKPAEKPTPDWRPHQVRFQSSNGTLFLTEGGHTWTYTANELVSLGYSLPKPPVVLNRPELESRGVQSIHRIAHHDGGEHPLPGRISTLIHSAIKTFEDAAE